MATAPTTRLDHRLALGSGAIMALSSGLCLSSLMAARAISGGPYAALSALRNWWAVATAVAVGGLVFGYLSGLFHQHWAGHHAARNGSGSSVKTSEWLQRLALLRFWVLMPLNFAPLSFGVAWVSMAGRNGSTAVPIWFQLGPLILVWPTDQDFAGTPPTLQRLEQRMWRWVWWLPVVIGLATVGGEIYGEPIVLLPLGTYWAGDYLGLWWVLRALNARHR